MVHTIFSSPLLCLLINPVNVLWIITINGYIFTKWVLLWPEQNADIFNTMFREAWCVGYCAQWEIHLCGKWYGMSALLQMLSAEFSCLILTHTTITNKLEQENHNNFFFITKLCGHITGCYHYCLQ